MDPVRNPFAPGAGNPPPELAGRQALLSDAQVALERIEQKRHAQGLVLVGLRGVGKTVLLNAVAERAEDLRFLALRLEVHEGKRFVALLAPAVRSALFRLSSVAAARHAVNRALRVLKSFVSVIKVRVEGVELSIEPEIGVADSGDLELDLPELIAALGEAAAAAHRPVGLFVDELQYLSEPEFSALIMSMHRASQKRLPVYLAGAGLPQIRALAGDSKSYAERLFRFPDVGVLDLDAAAQALQAPARAEGAAFEPDAIDAIAAVTECYPYFLQQWGYEIWNHASTERFTVVDVEAATPKAINELDRSFFRVRLERCTPAERRYMRALAELGRGPHRSGAVADLLQVKVTSAAPARSALIKKGMIYSQTHGETEFTVPLFDAFLRREIPRFSRDL